MPELLYHRSLADITKNLGPGFFEEGFVKAHDQENSLKNLEWEEVRLIAPIIKELKPKEKLKNYKNMVFTLSQAQEMRERVGQYYNSRRGA